MASTTAFTYNELIAELQRWLEESAAEYVASLPIIVKLGESRLYTDLNFEVFDRVNTGALTAGQYIQPIKTTTWQGTRSFHIRDVGGTGVRRYLQRRTYEYCLDFAPDETATAEPIYYAELTETQFFLAPAPNLAYAFEVREIQAPDSLTPSNQNTWLGDNAGDLLLYACLIASEEFIKADQEDIQSWKTSYAETMPTRRLELRRNIRGDYSPIKNVAHTAEDRP